MRVIRGDIFIVPNAIAKNKDFLSFNKPSDKWKVLTDEDLDDEEFMVQVWVASPDCNNWSSNSHPAFKRMNDQGYLESLPGAFADHFPISLLRNKDDGDTVVIPNMQGNRVELTCNQKEYRYRNHGSFKEVLDHLIKCYNEKHS